MSKKKLSTTLLISVLINVFLIGIVISFYIVKPNRGEHPPPRHGGPAIQFERAKEFLSEGGKLIVDEVLNQQGANMKDNMHDMRKLAEEARDVLTSEGFDAQRLTEIHGKMGDNGSSVKNHLSQTIYDIASKLSDEDRIRFFKKALPDHPQRPPPPRGH